MLDEPGGEIPAQCHAALAQGLCKTAANLTLGSAVPERSAVRGSVRASRISFSRLGKLRKKAGGDGDLGHARPRVGKNAFHLFRRGADPIAGRGFPCVDGWPAAIGQQASREFPVRGLKAVASFL